MSRLSEFYRLITEAVEDILEHGYDSRERLERWLERLESAARAALGSARDLQALLKSELTREFERVTRNDRLLRRHSGISEYTIAKVRPALRAELDRRILASADLIRLNRDASIARTLQRFSGWATSIPVGGTEISKRREAKHAIRRGIAALPFEERRVVIDQGHKLAAAVNEIVATDGGAIAAKWVSHWREPGYDFRPGHKALDGKIFVVRDNWALRDGLMKLDGHRYTDEVEQPAQEPFCRCYWNYFAYSLRQLPKQMLTEKGREALKSAHAAA